MNNHNGDLPFVGFGRVSLTLSSKPSDSSFPVVVLDLDFDLGFVLDPEDEESEESDPLACFPRSVSAFVRLERSAAHDRCRKMNLKKRYYEYFPRTLKGRHD